VRRYYSDVASTCNSWAQVRSLSCWRVCLLIMAFFLTMPLLAQALASVALNTDLTSPQTAETSITLTAAATGGTSVQYQFWVYNAAATPVWSQLQGYSSSATCNWTPAAPGAYLLSATALDTSSGLTANVTLWYSVINPVTAVMVATSVDSPQLSNTPITLTAMATGGGTVQYQFWCYNPAATPTWSQLQAYSAQASCSWTPTSPGDYLLSVTAQDTLTGAEVNESFWYTITTTPLAAVSLTSSPTSPQAVNTPITFTAFATGGTSISYQFWLYNPVATPAWSQLQAYSAANICSWTPVTPGNYMLTVTALDAVSGITVINHVWYTVTGTPLTSVTVTASPNSPQAVNTPITFTATPVGGTNVQYQFWLYNPAASPAWQQLQAYSPLATSSWTPSALGSYLLSVTAQDSITGTQVNDTHWYTVTGVPLTGVTLIASPASPQPANTFVTLTAAASGGTNVQYQFWVYNPIATPAWSQLQAYSTLATCAWTPASGSYLLSVTARDTATGTTVNALLWDMAQTNPQLLNGSVTQNVAPSSTTSLTLAFLEPAGTSVWAQVSNPSLASAQYSMTNTGGLSTASNPTPAQAIQLVTDANGQVALVYTAASRVETAISITIYNNAAMLAANAYATTLQFNVVLAGPTLTLLPKSSSEIDLSWTPILNALSYVVQRSTDGLNWSTVTSTLSPVITSYNDGAAGTPLLADTSYSYQVCANTDAGVTQFSAIAGSMTFPSQPTGLSATAVSGAQINLTWNTVAATGYRVYYKKATAASYMQFGTNIAAQPTVLSQSAQVTGLLPNTSYNFKVAAYNASGVMLSTSVTQSTMGVVALTTLSVTTAAQNIYYSRVPTDIISNNVPFTASIILQGNGANSTLPVGIALSITTDRGSFIPVGATQTVSADQKTLYGTLDSSGQLSLLFQGRPANSASGAAGAIVLPTVAELGTPHLVATTADGATYSLNGGSNKLPLLIGPPNQIIMTVTNPQATANASNQYFAANVNPPWGYAGQAMTVKANVYDVNNQPVLAKMPIWFSQTWTPCTDVTVMPSIAYYQSAVGAANISPVLTQTDDTGAVTNITFSSNHSGDYTVQCFALLPNADTVTLETINNINPVVDNGVNWRTVQLNVLSTDNSLATPVYASSLDIWIDTYVAFNTNTGASGWGDPIITVGTTTTQWTAQNAPPTGINNDGSESATVTFTGQDYDGKYVLPGTPYKIG